jgi:hypothetical protein
MRSFKRTIIRTIERTGKTSTGREFFVILEGESQEN